MGKPRFRTLATLGLALAWPAHAVEIDAIAIRSALGQPLLADIPVEASPEERPGLRASLAPAVVFARVGLARPQGTVKDLRFAITQAQGRPVIRVTTTTPVDEEFFSFLVQVDWGSGRMIREFSVALQPSAPAPWVDAPMTTGAGVEEAPATGVAPDAGNQRLQATAADAAAIPLADASVRSGPPTAAIAVVGAAPAAAVRRPASQPAESTGRIARDHYGPVVPGETLSHVASRLGYAGSAREQAFAALLAANPGAFIGGNINGLKRGAVLALPPQAVVAAIQPSAARHLVVVHEGAWHQAHDVELAREMEQALAALLPTVATATASPLADARLEIAAPAPQAAAAQGTHAASRLAPGNPGAGGDDAASREIERQHLRAQLTELEATVGEMRSIIAAQDQALARAQEQLATTPRDGAPRVARPWHWLLAGALAMALFTALPRLGTRLVSRRDPPAGGAAPRWHRRTT